LRGLFQVLVDHYLCVLTYDLESSCTPSFFLGPFKLPY